MAHAYLHTVHRHAINNKLPTYSKLSIPTALNKYRKYNIILYLIGIVQSKIVY